MDEIFGSIVANDPEGWGYEEVLAALAHEGFDEVQYTNWWEP